MAEPVASIATRKRKRVCKLLIPHGGNAEIPPPPVFCKKRLEVIDLTGVGFFGSAQEAARA